MPKERKLKKQGFMQGVMALMFSQLIIKLLGLVYKLYLTNREGFGDKGNAIYSAGFQIYALLLTLSSTGVPSAISKLVSERLAIGDNKGAHRIFKISFATFAVIGLIGTLILFFGAGYIANVMLEIPEAELTLVALSPSIFFVAIASVVRGYFLGREQMSASANSQTLEQVFKTLLTVIVVEMVAIFTGTNTVLMAAGANLATTLATFLSFAYIYLYYKSRKKEIGAEIKATVNYKPEGIKKIIKRILFVSIPISLSSLMSAINKNIDSVTVVRGLKNFLSEAEAKIQYGILSGKVDTLTSLPLSFNIAFATALVPSTAAAFAKGEKEQATRRVSFSLLITILIGLPCTVGMFILAQPILDLLFPNANAGAMILQISSLTIIFTVLAQTINGALQGIGKVIIPAVALGTGVLVKLILNLILVPMPQFGANGAAFASVVCHIISFSIGYTVLKKHIDLKMTFGKFVVKPLLATIMMSVITYFLHGVLTNTAIGILTQYDVSINIAKSIATIITLIIAVIVYVISVFALKVFSKEDIYMIPYGEKIYKILMKIGLYGNEGKRAK